MNDSSTVLQRQIEALEDRVTRLSAAVLRISGSLDLETVLQEVVDSAPRLDRGAPRTDRHRRRHRAS